MIKFAPAGLSIVLTFVTANAFAQERSALQSPSHKSVVDCATPAIPNQSQLVVIPSERMNGGMLLGLDEFGSEIGKSYAHAGAGDIGPGTDGLRTFYSSDQSDEVFGANPISQMVVVTLKASYEHCFSLPPSIAGLEDIDAANGAAILGLNLDDPRMEWKGGISGGWWGIQTILLRPSYTPQGWPTGPGPDPAGFTGRSTITPNGTYAVTTEGPMGAAPGAGTIYSSTSTITATGEFKEGNVEAGASALPQHILEQAQKIALKDGGAGVKKFMAAETNEWQGMELTDNEMSSSKTVGLAMPPSFGPTEFKALDVAAWNNKQLQYLPKRAEQSQPRAY
jgi:hypothetical protein